MNDLLRAEDLQVRLGGRAVLSVPALTVKEGEVFAVLGPNGAGKSTLLRVLAALQMPQQGRLFFRGREVPWRRALSYRRRVAVVLQAPLLLSMSTYANVALGLWLRGRWGPEVRRQAMAWLDRFQVAHLAERPAHTLSGGEAQRVALARAFALEPEVLFLDEPFAGLDMPTRLTILADLRQVLGETGRTAFLVTHDRDEALALADRVAVLFEGHLAQVGPVDEVFLHPRDEQVAAFVGVENRIPARIVRAMEEGVWVRFPWGVELLVRGRPLSEGACLVCVRPEEVALTAAGDTGGPYGFEGRVVRSVPLGLQVRVEVAVEDTMWQVLVPRRVWQRMALGPGGRVGLRLDPERIHLLPRSP